ncbi:LOW QUALITY PROTEIN: hypothetical protein NC652_037452 [Populus alba x Populus x berolinensis]|nr:LOW QUALITY PROTEIN: hypothetical protein NC652_037452 [Populus alba x Populus x berolinensis]
MNFYNVRVPKVPGSGAIGTLIKIGVLGGLGLYGATNSLYNVDRGHRAIMFNRIADELKASRKQHGCLNSNIISFFIKQHGCLNSNIVSFFVSYNFLRLSGMLPASHGVRPIIYDVRARPHLVESTSGSHDLQMEIARNLIDNTSSVKIGLRVLTRPTSYLKFIEPLVKIIMTDIMPASLLLRERNMEDIDRMLSSFSITFALSSGLYRPFFLAVSREIRKVLTARASNFHIALDDVAARDAERAKFIVEKAEQDKKSAVIRAEGEATSAQLIGQAIANNPAFITLRKIEAAREIAHTISNSANKVFLDSSDLLLNLQKMELENPRNK